MVGSLFSPGTLPQQLDELIAELRAVRGGIDELTGALGSPKGPPEREVIVIPFSSASLPNPYYVTTDQLRILAIDYWTDTAGRYLLQIENDPSIAFRAAVNSAVRVINPPGRLVVPRGLRIGFTSPGSAPFTASGVWDAILYAYAGRAEGRTD